VVRGADLATSTPRQIFLQQALGYPRPSYLHVPIAVTATGQKLSKQTRAAPLPDSPLPALLAAWSFLDQPVPFAGWHPTSVADFWTWATGAWMPSRVPRVPTLRAAETFGSGVREPV
jgi:glutamyl-Q tRNA(Asp) synthetase